MPQMQSVPTPSYAVFSPLMLSDRLITLAQAADAAGYTGAAEKLVTLAFSVLDGGPYEMGGALHGTAIPPRRLENDDHKWWAQQGLNL